MPRVLSGVVILALAATAASAADLGMGVPVVPPVVFTWSGCHVGGHIGGAFSDNTNTNTAGTSTNYSGSGFLGGGQFGCDYEFARGWVIGAEGRGAWSSLRGTRNGSVVNVRTGATASSVFKDTTDYLASATARLGHANSDGRWLWYARGGAAWTRDRYESAFVIPGGSAVDPTATSNRTGWTVGGGVEWAFMPQWSINAEYNYYDFGTQALTLTNAVPPVNIAGFNIHERINTTTVGVNYHF